MDFRDQTEAALAAERDAMEDRATRAIERTEDYYEKRLAERGVTIANLEHRLALATADPESQASQLISKHNALLLASKSLDELNTELRRYEAQIQELEAEILKYQDERDSWARVGKYAPIPVPPEEARYPGEVYWPDQSQNIEAVRRAWRDAAQEGGEAIVRVEELEAELRKYEPSDGVVHQRLGYLTTIKEAAELLDPSSGTSVYMERIEAWLLRPQVTEARKLR